jgi:hypothetical protein
MNSLQEEFMQALAIGLQDSSLTSCSRWAAKRRVMAGDFGGPYSWKHHPWVRELHDSWAPFNVAMKGAQLGVTEVAINRAFYIIDRMKRDVLYVLPTTLTASDFSKTRFGSALALSPYLRDLFTDTNSVGLKQAGANSLYIRGSRGESNLVSIPVSELILDEVDRMQQKAIALALERLSGQLQKHVWAISTPTIPEYGIHKLYLKSTQEHFYFKCPSCSRRTELVWPECIEIIGESVNDPRCNESFLKCKECKNRLHHEAKPEFLSSGEWHTTLSSANEDFRGFHISQLYSFTVTPGELVVAHFRGFGDEFAAKEFKNSKLGLPHMGDGARITDEQINAALRDYTTADARPTRAYDRFITLGADQGKTGYVSILEWFIDADYENDINVVSIPKLVWFGKFGEDEWGLLDQLMQEWQVIYAVVDADPQINEARRFCKRHDGFAALCRYRRGQSAKEIAVSEEDSGAPMLTVDRTNWLTATLGRLKTNPSRILLPRDLSEEYRTHLKNLVRTYEKDDKGYVTAEFKELGPEHFAQSLNYAEIALPQAWSSHPNQNINRRP